MAIPIHCERDKVCRWCKKQGWHHDCKACSGSGRRCSGGTPVLTFTVKIATGETKESKNCPTCKLPVRNAA